MNTLTVEKLQRATQLQEQVDQLQAEINELLYGEGNNGIVPARRFAFPTTTVGRVVKPVKTGKRQLTPEAIAAIQEGQRRRWAGLPSKKAEKAAKRAAKLAAKAAAAAATQQVAQPVTQPVTQPATEATAPAATPTAVVNGPATPAPTAETAPAVKPAKAGKLLAAA